MADAVVSSRHNGTVLDSNTSIAGYANWARSPYGVNLGADPSTLFSTLAKSLEWIIDGEAKSGNSGTQPKQTAQEWQQALNAMSKQENQTISEADRDNLAQGDVFYTKQGYTDTSVGGNDAINPYWQFNIDDDIVPPNLQHTAYASRYGSTNGPHFKSVNVGISGMGRVYSEMYDDNQQILWIGAGVPVFTNLGTFFMNAGDADAAKLMNSGDRAGFLGKLISYARSFTWWAITFPIMAPIYLIRWCDNFNTYPVTKYYSFKPTQTLYYELVNTMLSYLAVGMGLYPQFLSRRPGEKKIIDAAAGTSMSDKDIEDMLPNFDGTNETHQMYKDNLKKLMKKGISESGIPELLRAGPDIFKIMNKRNIQFGLMNEDVSTMSLVTELSNKYGPSSRNFAIDRRSVEQDKLRATLQQQKLNENEYKTQLDKITNDATLSEEDRRYAINALNTSKGGSSSIAASLWESLSGAALGIGDYVGFRIEKSTGSSESVSNSTGSTGLVDQINGAAAASMDAKMNFGGSKWMADTVKAASGNWKSLLMDVAGALTGGGISVVANGNGMLDIPEVWKNSSFNKSYNFNIQLRARYGDPVSIFQSIYIPLVMLLAYAMPRAVGDTMYTSPFIVRCYCKGMFSIPCGMVESMSITRGASEYGWSEGNLPTSVDVSLSIKDLSPTFFLSMQDLGFFDTFSGNTNMMEYLDTLSGLGIVEKLYTWPKMMRKLSAAFLINRYTTFSPVYWSQRVGRSSMVRAAASVVPTLDFETTTDRVQ